MTTIIKKMTQPFTEHPAAVGETYFQHMGMAFGFGARMVLSGLACLIHGIFPFFCVTTGSQTVTKLHDKMVTHRDKSAEAECDLPLQSSS